MTIYDFVSSLSAGSLDERISELCGGDPHEYLRRKAELISCMETFSRLYPECGDVCVYACDSGSECYSLPGGLVLSGGSGSVLAFASMAECDELRIAFGKNYSETIVLPVDSVPGAVGADVLLTGELDKDSAVSIVAGLFASKPEKHSGKVFDPELYFSGYSLCVTDVPGCELIPAEDAPEDIWEKLPELIGGVPAEELRRKLSGYERKKLDEEAAEALQSGYAEDWFRLMPRYRGVCTPEGEIALSVSRRLLGEDGAAVPENGCILSFVPNYTAADHAAGMELIYGRGSCRITAIMKAGARRLFG